MSLQHRKEHLDYNTRSCWKFWMDVFRWLWCFLQCTSVGCQQKYVVRIFEITHLLWENVGRKKKIFNSRPRMVSNWYAKHNFALKYHFKGSQETSPDSLCVTFPAVCSNFIFWTFTLVILCFTHWPCVWSQVSFITRHQITTKLSQDTLHIKFI